MTGVDSRCRACRSQVELGATFCPRCGAALRDQVPDRQAAVGPAPTGAWPVSAVFASAGTRVGAWVLDALFFGVLYVVATVLAVPLAIAGLAAGAGGFLAGLLLPGAVILAVAVWLLVWEGRTGKRIGNLLVGIRTVEVGSGGPPGFGRALGRSALLGVPGAVAVVVSAAITSQGRDVPAVVALAVWALMVGGPILAVASCGWDKGELRQGWHEKASGTSMVRVARSGAQAQLLGPGAVAAPPPVAPPGLVAAPPTGGAPVGQVMTPPVPVESESRFPLASPPAAAPASPTVADQGLIADVPGFARSAATPAVAGPASPATPSPSDEDEIEHTRISPHARPTTGRPRLAFDTGEVVDVTASGLVGRAPQRSAGVMGDLLVAIDDPDRSISKTHLSFEPDGEGIWVCDQGSTNGTEVQVPGEAQRSADAGDRVHVPYGATVRFGTRSFTVERG